MSKTPLSIYFSKIEQDYKKGIATEHTYRGTLKELLEALGKNISATNEPKRVKCGAPDYVVERDNLTIGYVEAKDIGVSLDKVAKDEQLGRYRHALDNLILTDYLEFRWYVGGEERSSASLVSSRRDKSLSLDKEGARRVEELLRTFLDRNAEAISKPQDLAKRMARLAHMIRDVIIEAFQKREASETLRDLYAAFQEVLLPDLTVSEFADMFAQTMAYGLFAARYNHASRKPFNRNDATRDIPRTNPFLRKLFVTIAGPDLDDEPFVGFVDELAQVLAYTDMHAVLADFGRKTRQEDPIVHFYETFLVQYDSKLRELRGVYYTPEPVVSYIVRSVDHLLRTHFDCHDGLADTSVIKYSSKSEDGSDVTEQAPRVLILDPATGTATFLYHVIAHIREQYRQMGNAGMWSSYVRDHLLPRLFGFELLVAPYAMAHLKLGMQLAAIDLPEEERKTWAYDFGTGERLGVYLTNTLDEVLKRSEMMFGRYISDEANEAAKVKKDYPVTVVLGNPPYSYESANTGKWISKLIRDYYQIDNQPLGERNSKGLQDDYVKFLRFAQWRIEQTGYGILAFITNHGYLENPTFRGMRQSLMQSFDEIYVLDLHGNSKKKERSPDGAKDENVFDIQQGVAIGIFVKRPGSKQQETSVHHADLWGAREIYQQGEQERLLTGGKYHWLAEHDITTTEWTRLSPQSPFYLFKPINATNKKEYECGWKVTDIFPINTPGIVTARDALTIHWRKEEVWDTINSFSSLSPEEARVQYQLGDDTRDWKVQLAQKDITTSALSRDKIKPIMYRPFDIRYTYYTGNTRGFLSMPRNGVMHHMLAGRNIGLITVRQVAEGVFNHILATNWMIDNRTTLSNRGYAVLLPLYLYKKSTATMTLFDTTETLKEPDACTPNLAPTFITDITNKLNMQFIQDGKGNLQENFGPEGIFNYMYAILHSPTYRTRYAEFLKIDFPRLPLTSNVDLFRELCGLGERLVKLHLMEQYGQAMPKYPEPGNNVVEKIEYTQPANNPQNSRVWINKTQYFAGVPPEVWNFHVGGYQVCQKWLKDRKERTLSFDEIKHYQRIIAALAETMILMEQIDETIEEHGGWPIP